MKKQIGLSIAVLLLSGPGAFAACEKTQGGTKSSFDGSSLEGLQIEKRSLSILDKLFPNLRVREKLFTGAIQSCTSCTDNFVSCSE